MYFSIQTSIVHYDIALCETRYTGTSPPPIPRDYLLLQKRWISFDMTWRL